MTARSCVHTLLSVAIADREASTRVGCIRASVVLDVTASLNGGRLVHKCVTIDEERTSRIARVGDRWCGSSSQGTGEGLGVRCAREHQS